MSQLYNSANHQFNNCWRILVPVQMDSFDWSWRPNPEDYPYIYVWGNEWHTAEEMPTIEYAVPGASKRKFMSTGIPKLQNNPDYWVKLDKIAEDMFDWGWAPPPWDPPYIYAWGSKWTPVTEKVVLEYRVPGATDYKFMDDPVELEPLLENWVIKEQVKNFDYTWRPDPWSPPYIYVWGNKWVPGELQSTLEYRMPDAVDYKYMPEPVELVPTLINWTIHSPVTGFDFTWRPDPREPAYIYVWGNKWVPGELAPTLEYTVPGAVDKKYMSDLVELVPDMKYWTIKRAVKNFDFTWRPNPHEPAYIYVWGNKWVSGEVESTLEYNMPGAVDKKYMPDPVELEPDYTNWKIYSNVLNFDFTWLPDPCSPPYIYVWGNKWVSGELESTLEYRVPGAVDKKYMPELVELAPDLKRWTIHTPVKNFDFTWRPDPREPAYIYVWGNKWVPGEFEPTLEYRVPGAVDKKYMPDPVELEPVYDRWTIHSPVTGFDFTWRPDPREPAYIYVWGNKWVSADLEATLEYRVPGAVDKKYMPELVELLGNELQKDTKWNIIIPGAQVDFTWRPDPTSPPYIYVWGNKWIPGELQSTLEYHAPGAVDKKYMSELIDVLPEWDRWKKLLPVDESSFDFTWRPDPREPAYIYVWGNQWNDAIKEPTLEYHVPGATDKKYMTDKVVNLSENKTHWKILIHGAKLDFSWRPDPTSPPYIYVWGNKWNTAATEPTITYTVPGATEYKYIEDVVATLPPTTDNWTVHKTEDWQTFDFSWRPNPLSPPQIYQWENGGPTYTVYGASDVVLMKWVEKTVDKLKNIPRYTIKTTLEDLIQEHCDEVFWALNPDLKYSKFDFSWAPNQENFKHINVFGNETSKDTQTYYINGPMWMLGFREYNYVEDQIVKVDTNLSMVWVDTGYVIEEQFTKLKQRYPHIQKSRFFGSWLDTVNRLSRKTSTKLFWVLSSEVDYSDFEFDFFPAKWQTSSLHVFGHQWNHWGNTYLVDSEKIAKESKWLEKIEHIKGINHVRAKRAKYGVNKWDILNIDFGNSGMQTIPRGCGKVFTTLYNGSYLVTILDWLQHNIGNLTPGLDYMWVTSSICDYSGFDFTWQMDPFQDEQLHVFSSDLAGSKQKFGDTFLINIKLYIELAKTLNRLEDYNKKINYIEHLPAKRLSHPVVRHQFDSQVDAIPQIRDCNFPYIELVDEVNSPANVRPTPINLWNSNTANIVVGATGGSHLMVPKQLLSFGSLEEVYDYPYIDKAKTVVASKPIDIVFISNGEPVAEDNYRHLQELLGRRGIKNKVHRITGINGRVASQNAAANVSTTNWYFLINGKLKVDPNFDWGWQPDRLQSAKHYIFMAVNPVNGLRYGHQAIVANNKRLTLSTTVKGLDFTMDSPHEVVNIDSGVALYNTDKWTTWRTAFRESIKLKSSGDSEAKNRLDAWLSPGVGDFEEWSRRGAEDGVEYWNKTGGKLKKLLLSYDWEWIHKYYINKYGD